MREDLLEEAIQRRNNDPTFAVDEFIASRKDQIVKTMGESIHLQNPDIDIPSAQLVAEIALQMHRTYHRIIGSTTDEEEAQRMKQEAEKIAGKEITNASINEAEKAIDQMLIDIVDGRTA